GSRSLTASGVTADAIGAGGLKAGDGAVVAFAINAKPAIAVLGGDDAGLLDAATLLAGHLPYVWDQKSPTTDKVGDDVKQFLAGKGIPQTPAVAPAVFVKSGGDGAERVVVDVQLTGGDFVKAQVALNQFKATAARDAKRPLSYPSAREIRVRLRTLNAG